MCVTSAIMQQWWPAIPQLADPNPYKLPNFMPDTNPAPNAIPWQQITKDPTLAAQMLEVIQRLEAIDKRLGLLEQCKIAAPEKKKIKAKLRRIAKKASK